MKAKKAVGSRIWHICDAAALHVSEHPVQVIRTSTIRSDVVSQMACRILNDETGCAVLNGQFQFLFWCCRENVPSLDVSMAYRCSIGDCWSELCAYRCIRM